MRFTHYTKNHKKTTNTALLLVVIALLMCIAPIRYALLGTFIKKDVEMFFKGIGEGIFHTLAVWVK